MNSVVKTYWPIVVYLLGFVVGYTKLQAQAGDNARQIDTIYTQVQLVQTEVNVLKTEVEVEKVQSKNVTEQVDKIDKKIDKVVDLLLEIKTGG